MDINKTMEIEKTNLIDRLFFKYSIQYTECQALSLDKLHELILEYEKGGWVGAVVSGKNGIEFKFTFGDKVWINDLQCFGRVLSCWHTRSGKQYELRYFVDGKHETSYLFEDELSEKKP